MDSFYQNVGGQVAPSASAGAEMTYGTKGTLRPTKSAEDYELEVDRRLSNQLFGAVLGMIVVGIVMWGVL
jgi:hypothetical protein